MSTRALATLSLADVLEVENDPALLAISCPETAIPLWTMLRVPFLRSIMSDALYRTTPLVASAHRIPKAAASLVLARSVVHNQRVMRNPTAEVLIAATGMGTLWRDGYCFNRLSDYFAATCSARTLTMEDFFAWRWPFPRQNGRVLLSAPLQAASALVGAARCGPVQRESAARLLELVGARARQVLGWEIAPQRAAALREWLARKAAGMPWLYRGYRTLLQRIRPRLLIKEEACYGPSATFISAARDLGIATAEYQHGVISAGHDAYNLAEALRSSAAYRRTLPDHLLGYGRWWLDQSNLPVQRVAIGNPHRSEQLLSLTPSPPGTARDVLILGDGIETRLYMELARRLAGQLGARFPVVFRPHPLERAAVQREFSTGSFEGVRIDSNVDIYQAFRSSHAVVSDLSTGLFEAVGIVERVFVWNTAKARFAFPQHPFPCFDDEADLSRQLLGATAAPLDELTVGAIWEPGWRTNYLRFLASVGCTTDEGANA